jgi:hypothetical protein
VTWDPVRAPKPSTAPALSGKLSTILNRLVRLNTNPGAVAVRTHFHFPGSFPAKPSL